MLISAWFRASCFFLGVTILLPATVFCDELTYDENGKPDFFPQSWPQFSAHSSRLNPRLVMLARSGDGRGRNAELTVFELVDKGRRLRQLHHTVLENPLACPAFFNSPEGRFFITMNEFEGSGTTPNCLVIYDLVRGERKARRLEEFLDEETRDRLSKTLAPAPGVKWTTYWGAFDCVTLSYFPNTPEVCRKYNLPFLKIDLRSQSVSVEKTLDEFPDSAILRNRSMQLDWDCSQVNSPEPKWNGVCAYPDSLHAMILRPASAATRAYLPFDTSGTFVRENDSGDYVQR